MPNYGDFQMNGSGEMNACLNMTGLLRLISHNKNGSFLNKEIPWPEEWLIMMWMLQVRVADKVIPQMAWLNDKHKVRQTKWFLLMWLWKGTQT